MQHIATKPDVLMKSGVRKGAKFKDGMAKYLFFTCACMSVVAVFGIIGYILYTSIPAFREIGVFNFLFGTRWNHASDDYGILTMIVSTLSVTFGAIVLGGTVGVFTAIFLVFWCPDKFRLPYTGKSAFLKKAVRLMEKINLRTCFDQIIKLLAGIPSVIFGYFGVSVILPALSAADPVGIGKGVLASSIVLAIMILPTVTSLSKNALEAVPEHYFEGALAVGNTKAQAVFRVVFPAARSGIISALILGIGRAVGETMAVSMVSGGRIFFPQTLFTPIHTLTTNISSEWADASPGSTLASALFATGFVLLVLVLIINLSINLVPKEFKGKRKRRTLHGGKTHVAYRKRGWVAEGLKYLSMGFATLIVVVLFALLLFILINGVPHLTWDFLFGQSSYEHPSLLPAFISTGYTVVITLAVSLPVGICSAIFLVEYARPGSKAIRVLRTFIDTLAGVPSIVFGLFGNLLFNALLGGYSVMAGAFTMALVVLPTVIRSTEEALLAVSVSLREASYGLGASKVRTIFKIVLPSAFPGIATAAILAIGRIIGESAALIYTQGMLISSVESALNPMNMGSTLTVFLYMCWAEPGKQLGFDQAYATAVVLLVITALLNACVYLIQSRVKRKR